jgi:hypothetical protein
MDLYDLFKLAQQEGVSLDIDDNTSIEEIMVKIPRLHTSVKIFGENTN